ncbi:MAG: DUF3810 domain-containing protein [Ruminococcaceae bacterium]|nr:DUF3810 domain-containing protein [Oscillospiraceae bacterium]
MKIVRRFIFTAAFLFAAILMIRAAKEHGDFLFMFYPGIMREIQVILSELTIELDYLLWERIALVALIWAGVTLLLDIILQENILRWISGVTAVLAFVFCVYVGLSGLNHYAPSVAEGMRMEVRQDYTVAELSKAAAYYRDGANQFAPYVERDDNGVFEADDDFEAMGQQLGSGMKNMIKTSYVFGGSTVAPKELGYLSRYDIPSVYSCFTGECCINPNVEDIAMPFLMSREAARRMSIVRDSDAEFVASLACIASDSRDYRYSGNFMAYRFCMEALTALDADAAAEVAEGECEELKADLAASTFMPEESLGAQWLGRMEELDEKEQAKLPVTTEYPDVASLLVGWHIHLTTPKVVEEDATPAAA